MKRRMRLCGRAVVLVALLTSGKAQATSLDDVYLEGYAAGLLKRDFDADFSGIKVRRGVLKVPVGGLSPDDRIAVLDLLATIPGVIEVQASDTVPDPLVEGSAARDGLRMTRSFDMAIFETGSLPIGHLFKPLMADPRWPHFASAYRNYTGGKIDGQNNASVSFGETLPFYRGNLGRTGMQWETGLQAGVFSEFNLDARSSDLINSDFIVSPYLSGRSGPGSVFLRVYHQSSHLGDEFLLQTQLERVNLSYEGADIRFSWEFPEGLRIYAGGGGIFHKEPKALKTWSTQYGAEFRSPWRFESLALRPIAGVDIRHHEQNRWSADVSLRAGLQVDNVVTYGRTLQFLLEYATGNSPTGQFYKSHVDYVGFGAHYNY